MGILCRHCSLRSVCPLGFAENGGAAGVHGHVVLAGQRRDEAASLEAAGAEPSQVPCLPAGHVSLNARLVCCVVHRKAVVRA